MSSSCKALYFVVNYILYFYESIIWLIVHISSYTTSPHHLTLPHPLLLQVCVYNGHGAGVCLPLSPHEGQEQATDALPDSGQVYQALCSRPHGQLHQRSRWVGMVVRNSDWLAKSTSRAFYHSFYESTSRIAPHTTLLRMIYMFMHSSTLYWLVLTIILTK